MASDSQGIRKLDFLALGFEGRGAISRRDGAFTSTAPWSRADFGVHRLKDGWWRLEIAGEANPASVELRLSSTHDPLLCIRGAGAAGARFRMTSGLDYEVSVLLSPWPGEMRFSQLAFTRLSVREVTGLYGQALAGFLRRGRWLPRLWNVARRMLAGQTVGLRVAAVPAQAAGPSRTAQAGIAAATGEIVERHDDVSVVLRIGDTLHADAVQVARAEFARRPEVVVLHGDAWEGGVLRPSPKWDPILAAHAPFPDPPLFVRSRDLEAITPRGLIARLAASPGAIDRIALPLASREQRPSTVFAPRPPPQLAQEPSVSVIIPTKFRIDLLDACLRSLAECTRYSRLDVVVVNNGSTDARLPGVLGKWAQRLSLQEIVDAAPFNFSRLVNGGVRRSTGEVVLLLNDDVEAIEETWLTRMVASAMAPDVGIVGARLLFPDRTIQHAGVVCGIGGVCGHLWRGLTPEEAERNPYVVLPREAAAVTGACIALRREVFDALGGLDEAAFPVALNDIDFCLRAREAGYRNIYRGDAVLIHHESQSRGEDSETLERRLRLRNETAVFLGRWKDRLADDPYASPAIDPMREDGAWHPALDASR